MLQHCVLATESVVPTSFQQAETATVGRVPCVVDGYAVDLDGPRLPHGWHAPEPDWRWTDGDPSVVPMGARKLTFDLAMTGCYLQENARDTARAA